jgi:hypothetical protein
MTQFLIDTLKEFPACFIACIVSHYVMHKVEHKKHK